MERNIKLTDEQCRFILENLDKALWYYFLMQEKDFTYDDYMDYCSRLADINHSLFG